MCKRRFRCARLRGNLRCGLHSSSFTPGVHSSSGCMHRKHFFVPATGAPAGDYELYLLGLDWLPEAIQPCCASGECGSSAPFVTRTTAERLVLHGLWPRYDPHRAVAGLAGARGAAWPEYCARSGADFTACCGEQAALGLSSLFVSLFSAPAVRPTSRRRALRSPNRGDPAAELGVDRGLVNICTLRTAQTSTT